MFDFTGRNLFIQICFSGKGNILEETELLFPSQLQSSVPSTCEQYRMLVSVSRAMDMRFFFLEQSPPHTTLPHVINS